jgi:hypothetical protein
MKHRGLALLVRRRFKPRCVDSVVWIRKAENEPAIELDNAGAGMLRFGVLLTHSQLCRRFRVYDRRNDKYAQDRVRGRILAAQRRYDLCRGTS